MTATVRRAPASRVRLLALLAVVGPGLLAGLSDDDPAGITTYATVGAAYGYQLLWVLLLSTVALVLFHDLASRLGVVTGQGLIGLVRERFGVRVAGAAMLVLLVANVGTTTAELAGVAAASEHFGVPRTVSVPLAAAFVSAMVLRGSFHRVEHVLLALSAVFLAYVLAGLLAGPSWSEAARGLVVPSLPLDRSALLLVTATVGTTLAPWGLAFMQSYAVDKQLRQEDLRYERVDVVVGAVLTGVIGFFVIVACAATLHVNGIRVESTEDVARSLEPLAGPMAGALFAVGLLGAALLAAAILPLSTAYSVCELVGVEGALDDRFQDARVFYLAYVATLGIATVAVLVPGAPLLAILILTQALNAILLVPLLVLMRRIARDPELMGDQRATRAQSAAYLVSIVVISLCVAALIVLTIAG